MERYYLKVSGMEGSRIPHKTLADAYTEARRLFDLARQKRRVYVLQVIGTIDPEEKPKKTRDSSRITATGAQRTDGSTSAP